MVKRRQSNGNVTVNAVIVISPRHRLPGLYGYRVARHDEAKAGGLFDRIGNFVVRWPLIVIGCWIAVAAALTLLLPTLQAQAAKREQAPLPPGAPSMVLQKEMSAAFQEKIETSALLLVLLTNENGLGPADEAVYRKLIENLRADTQDKISVQDFLAVPEMKELLASKDNKAWNLPITFAGDAASPETQAAFKRVAAIVKQTVAGTSLTVHLSGPIATVADLTELGEKDVRIIEIGAAVSVLIILILVYRNLVTMLVPLATIGASVVTAQGTLSGLAEFGLAVNMQAIVFMSAVMIGAGTDYAVFLISRYHDYVRHGEKSDMAVKKALMSIGKVITASAATVAVTFLAMVFTKLEVFSAVGPAIAVAITVSLLGAVTVRQSGHFGPGAPRGRATLSPWLLGIACSPIRWSASSRPSTSCRLALARSAITWCFSTSATRRIRRWRCRCRSPTSPIGIASSSTTRRPVRWTSPARRC